MKDVYDIVKALTAHVDQVAKTKGFDDSYAYRYGYFSTLLVAMFDDVLTPAQLKKLEQAVARLD